MPEPRRSSIKIFKEGAVRLVRETGRPIEQIAKDWGINAGTLSKLGGLIVGQGRHWAAG